MSDIEKLIESLDDHTRWMCEAARDGEYTLERDPDYFELQCALDNIVEAAQALATQIKLDNGILDE